MQSSRYRIVSALELVFGAAVVIGHNVFRIVPNEVIILCLAGLISVRIRDGGWSAIGFRRPESWRRILLIAVAAAAVRLLVGDGLLVPFLSQFWPTPKEAITGAELAGNLPQALLLLGLVWTFAAFGEEIAYRGYLVRRAADLGKRSNAAYLLAVIVVAVLFGYGHYYKGVVGVIDSAFAGLVLGAAFLAAGRNLWASILAHGFIDTVAVGATFLGWVD